MTIKAGDLVMVVRPKQCCGDAALVGQVFVVGQTFRTEGQCYQCGARWVDIYATRQPNEWLPTYCLIRIDPPAEPVSVFDRVEEPA